MESRGIYELTDLRIDGFDLGIALVKHPTAKAVLKNCNGFSRRHDISNDFARHTGCTQRRTFAFGLSIVRFCRTLRGSLGRERVLRSVVQSWYSGFVVEEADESVCWLEMIAAVGINSGSPLESLQAEANELSRIF